MKEKLKDILKSEFIGKMIIVKNSKNSSLIGIKGTVVDETKNTFVIEMDGSKKRLLKNQISFLIETQNKKMIIEAKRLCFRPDERVKKIR